MPEQYMNKDLITQIHLFVQVQMNDWGTDLFTHVNFMGKSSRTPARPSNGHVSTHTYSFSPMDMSMENN